MDEICASSAGARVQLLVRKLESQILNGEAKRKKKKQKPEAFLTSEKISAGRACGQAPPVLLLLEGDFLEVKVVPGAIG